MSFASDLLPDLHEIRAIPDDLGMRPHAVAILTGSWSGDHTGDGTVATSALTLSPNPKVRWLKDEAIVVAGLEKGSCTIGPITPGFPDIASLIGSSLTAGDTLHVRITGPKHPSGAVYRVSGSSCDRAFRYMLTCEPVSAA